MGSNAVNLEEDLCCPVCKKPLSSPGTPPKPKLHKIGRGKGRAPHLHNSFQQQRDTRMAVGKFKDNEEIVIAQCGHLFHKFCLRHYCYLVREGRSNHMYKVSCPSCDRHISMSSQPVDYRAHQDRPNDREKEFTKTSIMNNELSGQMMSVKQKLQRVEAAIDDGNHNFEIYRAHWRKLRKELKNIKGKRHEIESLYSEIERSEQMLKCMQNQQLKIVKKFIMKVKEKPPKDFIHFPRRLAPFLHMLEEDDRLIRDLGEIIVPIHLNHLKSDRQSLLKGIIATVHEKLVAQGKVPDASSVVTPEQQQARKPHRDERSKKPAIFVKVRKSSISILSSTSLTRESIQEIIQKVDIPLHGSRANKKKVRPTEKDSNNQVDNESGSDIKILYMPKRKMIEQTSEPCRTIDESESFAKVPARKCKSTDAVLVKTKKNKGAPNSSKVNKTGSRPKLEEKRSSTAGVMPVQSRKEVSTQNEACLSPVNAKKQDSVSASTKAAKCESCLENGKETNIEEAYTILDNVRTMTTAAPCVQDPETISNLSSNLGKPQVSIPTAPTTVQPPKENASLLKLIFDNLEKERKSTQNLESHRENTDWNYLDENNNEVFSDHHSNYVPDDFKTAQPTPQFFRVDGRGIARPESPHTTRFRQPTFLADSLNANISEKSFMKNTFFQPDEENQLDTLSPSERFLILSEHEAFLASSRRNCGALRRPMFHGIPACLGISSGGNSHFGIPPEPHKVPFYLKKWQQQLNSSRKVLKAIPRRLANNSTTVRSTRLLNSPKSDRTTHYNATYCRPQASSSYQRQVDVEKISQSDGIHLPPLSMYPAKRPTTAQCDNISLNYHHREGPEREISRIYNYDSVWK